MAVRGVSVAVAAMALSMSASAQQATQVVNFQVNAVNQLAVTGNPAPLVVSSAVAGSGPTSATMGGTSYAISTNETNQKIIASINATMPAGLSLEVSLAAPSGAASLGHVPLGTTGADVVTGISATTASALPINYRLNASPSAQLGSAARTVTFTVVSGA
jgi:hypothetical protein